MKKEMIKILVALLFINTAFSENSRNEFSLVINTFHQELKTNQHKLISNKLKKKINELKDYNDFSAQYDNLFGKYEKEILSLSLDNTKTEKEIKNAITLIDLYKFAILAKESYLYEGLRNYFKLVEKLNENKILEGILQKNIEQVISTLKNQYTNTRFNDFNNGRNFNDGQITLKFINFNKELYNNPEITLITNYGICKDIAMKKEVAAFDRFTQKIVFSEVLDINNLRLNQEYFIFVRCDSAIFRNGAIHEDDYNKISDELKSKQFDYLTKFELTKEKSNQTIEIDFSKKQDKKDIPKLNNPYIY